MIEIKLVGQELSGNLYITKKGSYVMDCNFSDSNDPHDMDLYSLTINNPDGEPDCRLKPDNFVVVKEFSTDE